MTESNQIEHGNYEFELCYFFPNYELHSIRETFGTTVPKLIMVKVWKHRRNVAAERLLADQRAYVYGVINDTSILTKAIGYINFIFILLV